MENQKSMFGWGQDPPLLPQARGVLLRVRTAHHTSPIIASCGEARTEPVAAGMTVGRSWPHGPAPFLITGCPGWNMCVWQSKSCPSMPGQWGLTSYISKRCVRGHGDQSVAARLKLLLHLIRGARDVSRRKMWKQLPRKPSFE